MIMKKMIFVIALLLVIPNAVMSKTLLKVAVVPQVASSEIQATWGAFFKILEEKTPYQYEMVYYPSIPMFEKGLSRGEVDIAFMNPYHAVMAYDWQKYQPIVHDKKSLVGILVVKADSPIKSVSQLNGEKLSFPAPNAFAASLHMRALLEQVENIKFKPEYVKTHTNVYRSVLFGMTKAGGGVNNTLIREDDTVKEQLRILYQTPATAPHPICVHPRVSKNGIQLIQNTIIELGKEREYQSVLDAIQIPVPVKADYEREYKPLKKLRLETYVVD